MSFKSSEPSIFTLAKSLLSGGSQVWVCQTEESLTKLKARSDAHWLNTSPLVNSATTVAGVSAVIVLCWMLLSLPPDASHWPGVTYPIFAFLGCFVVFASALTLILGTAGMLVMCHPPINRVRWLSEHLEPLSARPGLCNEALTVVANSPCARAYRDQVVAKGRQLRVGDYYRLVEQVAMDKELENKARCKALHRA
jgi:hypothetical protein